MRGSKSESSEQTDETDGEAEPSSRRVDLRRVGLALAAILAVGVIVMVIWTVFLDDDDPSGTSAVASVTTSDQVTADGGVRILQAPSLAAVATVAGVPVTTAFDVEFGTETDFEVTVTNDGNLTMGDITATIEARGDELDLPEPCSLPEMAPQESASCTLTVAPSRDTTALVITVLGFGPQDQEVDVVIDVDLTS